MYFYEYLKNKISGKSNKEIVAKLNLFHPIFKNLDEVTFSRWINNKITPSNKKIALIVLFFKDDYIDTITNIELKITSIFKKNLEIKKRKIMDPYLKNYEVLETKEFESLAVFPNSLPIQAKKNMEIALSKISKNIEKTILFQGVKSYLYCFYFKLKSPLNWEELNIKLYNGYYILNAPTYLTHIENSDEALYALTNYTCEQQLDKVKNTTVILMERTNEFDKYYQTFGYSYHISTIINNKKYYIYKASLIDILTSDRVINTIKKFNTSNGL
ncbi:hypothetical protein NRD16_001060 [Photobacterium damselae]|nr:hypothetical protein [Photobacterium damselae]